MVSTCWFSMPGALRPQFQSLADSELTSLHNRWEFFTTLDFEWRVIRGRVPYRWTIWVCSRHAHSVWGHHGRPLLVIFGLTCSSGRFIPQRASQRSWLWSSVPSSSICRKNWIVRCALHLGSNFLYPQLNPLRPQGLVDLLFREHTILFCTSIPGKGKLCTSYLIILQVFAFFAYVSSSLLIILRA